MMSTETTPATTEKSGGEVVPQPTREVVTADVVSGAPGALFKLC